MVIKGAITSTENLEIQQHNGEAVQVSGYERSREERIKENLERMQKLGILNLSLQLKATKPSRRKATPFSCKTPLRDSPLPPPGPTRRSSRLQNVTPISYSEVEVTKKDKSIKIKNDLLRVQGSEPEIYTEEHEKLLGSTEQTWTFFVDGYGKDGKRIYDPINGKTCHQCRQKTLGHRSHCSNCNMVQGQFCGDCLYMRYGEHVIEAKQNPNWICPVCRGICNCSLCRQAKGWPPTGALYRKISSLGYKSVAHYLIQTRRADAGSDDLTTKAPLSARRSLPFLEQEIISPEKETFQSDNPQRVVDFHLDEAKSSTNFNNGLGERAHCSVDAQVNCTPKSKNRTGLMVKPELTIEAGDDRQDERKHIIQIIEKDEEFQNIKKSEEVLSQPELKEFSCDPTSVLTPAPEDDKTQKDPASNNKSVHSTELVADSIAGRLRLRRNRNSNHEDMVQEKGNGGTTMNMGQALDSVSSPVIKQTIPYDKSVPRPMENNTQKKPGSRKRVGATVPVADSIAGRLRQRQTHNC